MKIGSLQTRITVFFGILMVGVQLLGLLLTQSVGSSNARTAVAEELATGERLFHHVVEQRTAQLAQAARVLAGDYAFREALASHDDETIASALTNHGTRIRAQLMVFVGRDHTVAADVGSSRSVGDAGALTGVIAAAEKNGTVPSIVVLEGHLYQVVAVPVAAPLPVGWVAMGFVVDDAVAKEIQRITDLDITFFSRAPSGHWTLQATTLSTGLRASLDAAMDTGTLVAGENTLNGEEYLTRMTSQAGAGGEPVVAVLQTSLEKALAPFGRLMRQLGALALVGILVSMLCSVAIARGIAKPVSLLAAFARRIAAGNYADPPRIVRGDEIGDLSIAFDHMRDGIEMRERKIMDLAYRDALTGLPNRALFTDRLQQAVAGARRTGAPLSVLVMDLDRFKYVNDTLGYDLGDVLLREVAARLAAVMRRGNDTVARLGADEFAILLPTADIAAARKVAHKIVHALVDAPLCLDGHMVDVQASIGISNYPEHGEDLDSLVRRADIAMYLAKTNGTGIAIYDPQYDQQSAARLSLMGELRRAVEEDQLVVYYQPKVALGGDPAFAAEALIRWQHPRRGFIPPVEFIPFAEQTGYIRQITMWMLDRVIAQCAAWHRAGLPMRVAVNISARDLLNPELATSFADMLARHRLGADAIWLEITESAILENTTLVLETLDRLAALGCKLSIDDYGTGYSSLSYLKRLPVDELKIDRSFVMNMVTSHDDRIIVQSTIDLAHNMGLTVTAEGVEDDETFAHLKAMGCDMAQGYLMSKPVAADDLARWMAESRWVAAVRETGVTEAVEAAA